MHPARPHTLREPCRFCLTTVGSVWEGYVVESNGQDVVRCSRCNRAVYNAPRTETGRTQRTVTTIHNGIKPNQRARILMRDGRCVLCGSRDNLHVGHLIPVVVGLEAGLTDLQLNDDENLAAMCEECNLGMAANPPPLWIVVPLLRARLGKAKR